MEAQRLHWQSHGLSVHVEGEATHVPVDREKMASAIGNLLLNAIRFSPHGGTIRLALQSLPARVRIDIVDQGPGVAPADRERSSNLFTGANVNRGRGARHRHRTVHRP